MVKVMQGCIYLFLSGISGLDTGCRGCVWFFHISECSIGDERNVYVSSLGLSERHLVDVGDARMHVPLPGLSE